MGNYMAFWKKKKEKKGGTIDERIDEELKKIAKEKSLAAGIDTAAAEKKAAPASAFGALDERLDELDGGAAKAEAKPDAAAEEEKEAASAVFPAAAEANDKKAFVREGCEAVMENDRLIAEAKKEYEQATSMLTDIQKIDRIDGEERRELVDICKNIVNLVSERNGYKNRNLAITDEQIRRFEPYDDDLADEVKKMYSAEAYQRAIEGDISNLKKEKEALYVERSEIIEKQNALKRMAKVVAILIVSLFVLFAAIYYALKTDMTLPYLGTMLLAAGSVAAIFIEANKNRRDMAVNDRKVAKATSLMNSVKIKYVNNVNMLDFNCEKFGVKDAADFESKWNEYRKVREYERRFRENTEKLNLSSERLLNILKENEVVYRDIWISRAAAIVDDREMVEIRHELNLKRQNLRKSIENGEKAKADIIGRIDDIISQYPHMRKELFDIVKEYSVKEA